MVYLPVSPALQFFRLYVNSMSASLVFIAELEHPEFKKFDLSCLRTGIMGKSYPYFEGSSLLLFNDSWQYLSNRDHETCYQRDAHA